MEFLNLFANYRLKVQAALDEGIDKRPEVVEDLRNNRIQLAVPPPPNTGYLIERKVVDPAVESIFKRRDDEMLLSLIYVSMRPNDPTDTLRAYKRALGILDKVRGGANFAEIAKDSSDDPSTKDNGGRLPSYITAGMILPPIEDAAYETKPGGIYPGLVRVPAGFVVLKVIDRSPRYKVRAAHILIAAPQGDMDPNSPARRKADSVLKLIRNGADFAKLAREVSDDRVSAENGGDFMGYYTRSLGFEAKNAKLEPEIEAALFKLKDGEVSDVIHSEKYGYHILKRLESRRPTFDEEKETIRQFYKQRLMADDRAAYARSVAEKHGLKVNDNTLAQVLAAVNQSATTADTAWATGIGRGLRGETLFSYGAVNYTVASLIDSAKSRPDMRAVPLTRQGIRNAIYGMFEQTAMIEEAKNLETEYPEFATLMQEFRDGILIFNLEDEMIWKKLNSGYTDERGRAFFERHPEKYKTLPKLALSEIFLFKEDEVKDLYNKAKSGAEPFDTLAAHYTQRQDFRERAGHWALANAKNADIVKQVLDRAPNPKPGDILEPFEYQGGWSIVRIDSVEAPRPMTYEEAKPEVQGDFIDDLQKDLTREWLDTLRLKYRVKIDEKTLKNALAAK
jgi:peptidyl-prolyl cis-trans isomerase SurA